MNDLNTRLANHIAQMAPHASKRQAGQLLIEAADKITELEKLVVEARQIMLAAGKPDNTPDQITQYSWLDHVSKFEFTPFV